MSEKKVLARVGNFQVTGEFGDGHDWISVKAVSGFWTLRFRDDNRMFAFLTQLCSDRDLRPYLECWINANYVMTTSTPDLEYYDVFFEAYSAFQERERIRIQRETPEESEDEILREMKTMQEMTDEIKKEK
jgi:hypothetical protein